MNFLTFFRSFVINFVLAAIILFAYPVYADEFPWPIAAPRGVSSSFGEPRAGRFHFGVDCRSGGVTGKKVFAIGDGCIYRVNTSPFGYGKALYLKLDTGEIVVYGHLSGFLPDIEAKLFSLRRINQSYDVDYWPQPDAFRVKRGDLVAYSGDTGSGAAHLHLELRDANNVPINPYNHGLPKDDSIAPVINSVLLIPLDNASSVDGYSVPRLYDFSSPPAEPFVLTGRVGLAVSTDDSAERSTSHLGVYSLSLFADSTMIFTKSYDKIPYEANGLSIFDHLSGLHRGVSGTLCALFRHDGNSLNFYNGDGILYADPAADVHRSTLSIRAEDHSENALERSLPVIYGARPYFTDCGFTENGSIHIAGNHFTGNLEYVEIMRLDADGEWVQDTMISLNSTSCDINVDVDTGMSATYRLTLAGDDSLLSHPLVLSVDPNLSAEQDDTKLTLNTDLYHDRVVLRIDSSGPLASLPVVHLGTETAFGSGALSVVPDGENSWLATINFPQSGKTTLQCSVTALTPSMSTIESDISVTFTAAMPGSKTTVISPDSLFTLVVPSDALYRPAPVVVDTAKVSAFKGLNLESMGYRVSWGDRSRKKVCTVTLNTGSEPHEKAAMYSSANGKYWNFVTAEHNGGQFMGVLGGSGYVAILTDTIAPYVSPSSPKSGSTVKSRQPLLRARVDDSGSGLEGSDSIKMWIDDIPIYGEFDAEKKQVSYTPRNPQNPGSHTVKVTVTDRMNNSTTKTWKFTIAQ